LPLNDLGQVIGQSQANNGRVIPTQKPFLWQNGNLSYFNNLDDLGGGYSKVFDINNSGQVVSRKLTSSRLAFLWQNGTKTDLENNGSDNSSVAVGINNSGQVVGWSYQAVVITGLMMILLSGVVPRYRAGALASTPPRQYCRGNHSRSEGEEIAPTNSSLHSVTPWEIWQYCLKADRNLQL
jgi:probable HAF family extracellular repeat protein